MRRPKLRARMRNLENSIRLFQHNANKTWFPGQTEVQGGLTVQHERQHPITSLKPQELWSIKRSFTLI